MLDGDPFAMFLLRGRDRDTVLSALRSRRGSAIPQAQRPREHDTGIAARQAYAITGRPALPMPALPPARPGRPATLAIDPPAETGIDPRALTALAADAAQRAHQLLLGEGDGSLALDHDADLARRASTLVGTPDFEKLRPPGRCSRP